MTPQEWKDLIDSETATVKEIKRVLEREMRAHLSTLLPGVTIPTNNLVQEFIPSEFAALSRGNHDAQKALSGLILQIAGSSAMEDCCIRGEVSGQYMGKPKRPWIWFAPVEQETCCMCGQVIVKGS